MYIRCKTFPNRRVLGIYHSVRTGSKVSQKLVKYIGSAHNDEQYAILMRIAEEEVKKAKIASKKPAPKMEVFLEDILEECRIIEGFHDICGTILDRLKLGDHLTNYRYEQLKDVIIARIANPTSKLQTAHFLRTDFLRPMTENRIYRLMDDLFKVEREIKKAIFEFTSSLCEDQKIDLLLFDVTTLYFESQKADEIRDFGYSKDHKVGEIQVVLALATTSKGLPICYHLFSGKTAEVSTLLASLNTWKEIFTIDKVTLIADRAMMSEDNLIKMEQADIDYIVAAKLKSMPKGLQEQILQRAEERETAISGENVWIQEREYKGRRLVIGWSKSRSDKDKSDRERLIARLRSKLSNGESVETKKLVTNRGYLKFTNEKKTGQLVLNEAKIVQDAKWDGLHGVLASNRTLSAADLLTYYRRLWAIEESFRINKHTLAMRPIYHFSSKRIKAHILICYIAFAVSRYLQHNVRAFDKSLSVERIREALFSVQASLLRHPDTDILYRLPSNITEEAKMIYKAFGVKRLRTPSRLNRAIKCSATKKMQVIDA